MNVAVIGLGLIGGSLLRTLAAAGHWTIGYDADPATRAMARTAAAQAVTDARWQVAPSVHDALQRTSLAVIATPLTSVSSALDDIANAGYTGLVTDVVSVKKPVRDLVARRLTISGQRLAGYVGGHPMAGRETAGFAAADATLFRDCAWALCLDEETDLADWLTVANLLTGLRVRVVPTTSADHDLAVAAVSHVPHLLASALAAAVADPLAATLAAGSFRDATRVAAGPPDLVGAMCGGNAEAVARALDTVLSHLGQVRDRLTGPDRIAQVRDWARPGHEARITWPRGWGAPTQLATSTKSLLALGDDGGWITSVAPDRRTVTAVRPV